MTLMTLMMWVIIGMAVGSGLILALALCGAAARRDREEDEAYRCKHSYDNEREDTRF